MKATLEPSDSSGGTKMEPPEKTIPTYADLGIDKKDAAQIKLGGLIKEMPKNEGAKGQLIGRSIIGATKMEVPIKTIPTYSELGITYKDAAQWQDMAKHKRATPSKLEAVAQIPTYSTYNENHS